MKAPSSGARKIKRPQVYSLSNYRATKVKQRLDSMHSFHRAKQDSAGCVLRYSINYNQDPKDGNNAEKWDITRIAMKSSVTFSAGLHVTCLQCSIGFV